MNNNLMLYIQKTSPIKLYFVISFFGILFFFVLSIFFGHDAFSWIAMHHFDNLRFTDYFRHVSSCFDPDNLYWKNSNTDLCFPPLAYVMYFFLNRITTNDDVIYGDFETAGFNLFVFFYYTILSIFLLYNSILYKNKAKFTTNILLTLSLLFSIPFFMGCVERGNSTLLMVSLLILFYKFQDSESKYKKIVAIVLLSICIGFKIYPAIFSAIYIKNKRFKEFFALVIISSILFFVPFIFFGGIEGFICWLDKILSMVGQEKFGRIEDIKALVYTLQCVIFDHDIKIITKFSPYLFLIICIFLFFKTGNKFNELFFLCAIMVFFPSQAYRYTLSYFAIPLICFIEQLNDRNLKNYIICITYGFLFTIPSLLMAIMGLDKKIRFEILNGVTYTDIYIYSVAYFLLLFIFLNETKNTTKKHCIVTHK